MKIEIIITTESVDAEILSALTGLLSVMNNQESSKNPDPVLNEPISKKTTPLKKEQVVNDGPPQEGEPISKKEVKDLQEVQRKEQTTSVIKIEDIRALLQDKVENHRTEIKTKLSSIGVNNVSTLKPENYKEFYKFLSDLK